LVESSATATPKGGQFVILITASFASSSFRVEPQKFGCEAATVTEQAFRLQNEFEGEGEETENILM